MALAMTTGIPYRAWVDEPDPRVLDTALHIVLERERKRR